MDIINRDLAGAIPILQQQKKPLRITCSRKDKPTAPIDYLQIAQNFLIQTPSSMPCPSTRYGMLEGVRIPALADQLIAIQQKSEDIKRQQDQRIQNIANGRLPILFQLLVASGSALPYSISDCIRRFGSSTWWYTQNHDPRIPHGQTLDVEQVASLTAALEEYLIAAIASQQGIQALEIVNHIAESLEKTPDDPSPMWMQQLGQELTKRMVYPVSEYPEILVFEYQTGIRLSQSQVEWIAKLRRGSSCPQFLYGCQQDIQQVIPLLCFTIAQSGKIPIFLVSDTQFMDWRDRLSQQLRTSSQQSLHSVNFCSPPWSEKKIIQLHDELLLAQQEQGVCVLPRSLLSTLQLELLSGSNRNMCVGSYGLELVSMIFNILYCRGTLIYDPLDEAYSPIKKICKPIGELKQLPEDSLSTLCDLFCLLYCNLPPRSVWIEDTGQWEEDMSCKQLPSVSAFLKESAPELAKGWLKNSPYSIPYEYEADFVGFVTDVPGRDYSQFMRWMQDCHMHSDLSQQAVEQKVHQVRYFLRDLIPTVLKQYRKLGDLLDATSICDTQGDAWVYIAYAMCKACTEGLSHAQILRWHRESNRIASMEKVGTISLDETLQGKKYKEWTGMPLKICEPSAEDLGAIKQKLLLCPNRMMEILITYPQVAFSFSIAYPDEAFVGSTQDLLACFPIENRVALMNMPTHDAWEGINRADAAKEEETLQQRLYAKFSDPSMSVVILENWSLRELLDQGDWPGCAGLYILDVAGIFETVSPIDRARRIVQYVSEVQEKQLEAVLFFQHHQLMVWRLDQSDPISIGKEEYVSDYGIDLNRCITWYGPHDMEHIELHKSIETQGWILVGSHIDLGSLYRHPYWISENPYGYPMRCIIAKTEVDCLLPGDTLLSRIFNTANLHQNRLMREQALYTFKERLEGVVRRFVWKEYVQSSNKTQPIVPIEQFQDLWLESKSPHPNEWYANGVLSIDSQGFFENLSDRLLRSIDNQSGCIQANREGLRREILDILAEIEISKH